MCRNDLKNFLAEVYSDVPESDRDALAKRLLSCVNSDCGLGEIISAVLEWECEENVADTQAYYVYSEALSYLPQSAAAARRLYEFFMHEYDDFDTFLKLYTENGQYLTGDELAAVRKKAWRLFDKELMRSFGFCWGE